MESIKKIQSALKQLGFDPGNIDGVIGPNTRAAISKFQKSKGLAVDGIVGQNTFAALFAGEKWTNPKKLPTNMPWLIEAYRHLGLQENSIKDHDNSTIMKWASSLKIGYSSDEVPWCGLFMGHCIGSQLPDEPLPVHMLGARNWKRFGKHVTPQLGSVLVFWRSSLSSWKGHVGLYWAEDNTHYHVLGGNQSNKVSIKRVPKARLLDARWPKSVSPQGIVRISSSAGVLISTTEQ